MSQRFRLRDILFTIYVLLCLGAVTWPGYMWFGNSIKPYVFGLPFSLVWVVLWVLLTFVALVTYYATDRAGRSS